jgi:hypothetical protein
LTKFLKTISIIAMDWLRLQRDKSGLAALINFFTWSFVFAIIYAQSPLYTSNQNQYFLHGLAGAGYGFLVEDWLANTIDPAPIFSLLVNRSYRLFHAGLFYYGAYVLLFGVYLRSIYGIVDELFDLKNSRAKTLEFLALFLGAHSAGWRYFLSRLAGPDWSYLLEGGVAGQRLLGTVLQPSTFGVLLVLSIYLFLKDWAYPALAAMAGAVLFHPTYLLSAGILTLAYMVVESRKTRRIRSPLLIGLISSALVFPVLLYVWISFGLPSSEYADRAQEILVEFRIPHHAVFSDWFNLGVVFQIAIVGAALWIIRRSRLFHIILVCAASAAAITGLQLLLDSDGLALLFPWRISVVLVPLSLSIILGFLVTKIINSPLPPHQGGAARPLLTPYEGGPGGTLHAPYQAGPGGTLHPPYQGGLEGIPIASLALIVLLTLIGAARFKLDVEERANRLELQMMQYVRESKRSGDFYLVPTKLQDFRLETGAPIYIDFKSIPYAQDEILEWHRRVLRAGRFYREKREACDNLETFVQEGITHVVLETNDSIAACKYLREVYLDSNYGVYKIDLQETR